MEEKNSTESIKKSLLRGNDIYPIIRRDSGIVEIYSGVDTKYLKKYFLRIL